MPLTVASGVDMPRLAIGEALGEPIADGPIEFRDIAMVRYFEERFFSLRRHLRPAAARRPDRRMNLRQDMHVHSTFSDGRDAIEDNVARAEGSG